MDDGKLLSHNVVVSVDKVEQVSTSGTLDSRHKLALRVIALEAVVRVSGYYEIEVGAQRHSMDRQPAPAPSHKARRWLRRGTSLTTSGGALSRSGQALLVH